ncbi:DUF2141 domain-containing protein [Polaribacter sp. IC073]|uniref:DUF2141 domain-containing protein n=1 Tax=Polaribacter sp. IC073 TaxID=2508540 RepID=UPI0011BDD3AF|nr:DUF2141 domain-containing protein [Polaribacter sp. IC073]TXD47209.1 DUF2141 domain-containing protein [Polaribacter sp. IC073]
MNSIFLYIALLTTMFSSNNPQLTLHISNIEKMEGKIRIGVFNKKEGFLKEGKSFKAYLIEVDENSETIIIRDLPKGAYAISLYHDVNSDNVCNRNFFGIPKEKYGFSNNIKPKLSAPKYKDCKFLLKSDTILDITLLN